MRIMLEAGTCVAAKPPAAGAWVPLVDDGAALAALSARICNAGPAPWMAAMPPTVRTAANVAAPAIRNWKLRST
jgi:hypothetical protein